MVQRYKVVIIKSDLKQYRAPLYRKLRESLAQFGVDLTILYSTPNCVARKKGDSIDLSPPLGKRVPRLYMLRNRLLFQFMPLSDIVRSDLIIVMQANKDMLNYPLLLLSRLGLKKVAFWGHGYNRQGNSKSLSERFKRLFVNWTDWWFAYTQGTANYLTSMGVAPDKITSIENAIDTRGFQELLNSVTREEIMNMRHRLGICESDRIGLYCGSLYAEKRVHFLLNAAMRIAVIEPRFRLLVVGGGSEADLVQHASKANACIIYAGPLFGREKAICFRIAEVFLHPGAVGLGILDSFAGGLPFVSTPEALHGPEIDYLINGINGLMVSGDEDVFAKNVAELLGNIERAALMRQRAEESASRYTIENMVQNVVTGVLACLGIDARSQDCHD